VLCWPTVKSSTCKFLHTAIRQTNKKQLYQRIDAANKTFLQRCWSSETSSIQAAAAKTQTRLITYCNTQARKMHMALHSVSQTADHNLVNGRPIFTILTFTVVFPRKMSKHLWHKLSLYLNCVATPPCEIQSYHQTFTSTIINLICCLKLISC